MRPFDSATPAEENAVPTSHSLPTSASLARSAGVVGAATMVSRILGLLRDQTLAYVFGAGNAMDAFYVAYRIPNLMRDLFAEGVMSAAFVPAFMRRLTTEGRRTAWELGTQLINALIVITLIFVVTGIIFAEPLTRVFAEDYAKVPGKLELTVQMTRVMLPFLTLVAIAAACMGMLNSLQRFFVPALSPAMFNISLILSSAMLVPLMPRAGFEPIMAIAFGVVLGGVGQIIVQYWLLRREGFRYRIRLNLRDSGLREILRLMGPGTIAGAAMQLNLLVNTILATSQGTGAVSWLTYAFRLMYLPLGVFGVSIATAALPVLSRYAALDELHHLRRTISHALRLMLMFMVPAVVGLTVLAVPIVRLIFERGNFTPADTQATALALACYAPGIIGYAAVRIMVPSFYALGTSMTPALVAIGSVGLNIVLNLLLVRVMGYPGLALGSAIAALSNSALLLVLLRRRLDGLEITKIMKSFALITASAVLMGVAVWQIDQWFETLWPAAGSGLQIVIVGSEVVAGLVVLALSARLLGVSEFNQTVTSLAGRLWRRNQ